MRDAESDKVISEVLVSGCEKDCEESIDPERDCETESSDEFVDS